MLIFLDSCLIFKLIVVLSGGKKDSSAIICRDEKFGCPYTQPIVFQGA
jgi:hypothetical protein